MQSATGLAVWIADALVPGARPERRSALHNAYKLAEVAVSEAAIEAGPEGYARFARFFAQLAADGWLAFDYQVWPQDPEPPPPPSFTERHLQRADNVRLTPGGLARRIRGAVSADRRTARRRPQGTAALLSSRTHARTRRPSPDPWQMSCSGAAGGCGSTSSN